jgi:hypothetical protein
MFLIPNGLDETSAKDRETPQHWSLTSSMGVVRSTVYLQVYGSARLLAHSFDAAGRIEWQSDPPLLRLKG